MQAATKKEKNYTSYRLLQKKTKRNIIQATRNKRPMGYTNTNNSAIFYYVPLEWGGGALLLNFNPLTSHKDALCQIWLKLAHWLWRRFLNFVNVFSLFRDYPPLEKGRDLHLKKKTSIPFTQGHFVPSLVEIGPVVLEKMKMWKIYRWIDRKMDDGQYVIRIAH